MFCCYSWCLPESYSNLFFFGSDYILFVVHVNTLVLTELMKSEIFENHIIIKYQCSPPDVLPVHHKVTHNTAFHQASLTIIDKKRILPNFF